MNKLDDAKDVFDDISSDDGYSEDSDFLNTESDMLSTIGNESLVQEHEQELMLQNCPFRSTRSLVLEYNRLFVLNAKEKELANKELTNKLNTLRAVIRAVINAIDRGTTYTVEQAFELVNCSDPEIIKKLCDKLLNEINGSSLNFQELYTALSKLIPVVCNNNSDDTTIQISQVLVDKINTVHAPDIKLASAMICALYQALGEMLKSVTGLSLYTHKVKMRRAIDDLKNRLKDVKPQDENDKYFYYKIKQAISFSKHALRHITDHRTKPKRYLDRVKIGAMLFLQCSQTGGTIFSAAASSGITAPTAASSTWNLFRNIARVGKRAVQHYSNDKSYYRAVIRWEKKWLETVEDDKKEPEAIINEQLKQLQLLLPPSPTTTKLKKDDKTHKNKKHYEHVAFRYEMVYRLWALYSESEQKVQEKILSILNKYSTDAKEGSPLHKHIGDALLSLSSNLNSHDSASFKSNKKPCEIPAEFQHEVAPSENSAKEAWMTVLGGLYENDIHLYEVVNSKILPSKRFNFIESLQGAVDRKLSYWGNALLDTFPNIYLSAKSATSDDKLRRIIAEAKQYPTLSKSRSLVKRGEALNRIGRWEQAIACYATAHCLCQSYNFDSGFNLPQKINDAFSQSNKQQFQTNVGYWIKKLFIDVVDYLLTENNTLLSQLVNQGELPLHEAILHADDSMGLVLIRHGVDVTLCDNEGNTALHLAAKQGYSRTLAKLVKRLSLDLINQQNSRGETALHCLARGADSKRECLERYEMCLRQLLGIKADDKVLDNDGNQLSQIIKVPLLKQLLNSPKRLLWRWQANLQTCYLAEDFAGKNLLDKDAFPLKDCFVNLQVVLKKEKVARLASQSKDKSKPIYKPLRERDRLNGDKKAIESLTQLFDANTYQDACNKQPKEIKTVLVSGIAGVGKSTLSRYIAYQWALFRQGDENKKVGLWSMFDVVLIIPCRRLRPNDFQTEWDEASLLRFACLGSIEISDTEVKSLLLLLKNTPDKCLLIFDGLDELPLIQDHQAEQLKLLFKLPFKKLVTTRSYAIDNLKAWSNSDGLVEITGFKDKDVVLYFNKYLGDEKASRFIKELKQNNDLWKIAHIPINAYLLKQWWQSTRNQPDAISLTQLSQSDLYETIIMNLCRRYIEGKEGRLTAAQLNFNTAVTQYGSTNQILKVLGEWAFEGLVQDTANLNLSWLSGVDPKIGEYTLLTGYPLGNIEIEWLREYGLVQYLYESSSEKYYCFLHLTFQEFLAARVIVDNLKHGKETEKKHVKTIINTYKYHPNFTLVWPFVAGALRQHPKVLNDFFNQLLQEPRDWVGIVEANLLCRCLEASLSATDELKKLEEMQQAIMSIIKQRFMNQASMPEAVRDQFNEFLSESCPQIIRLELFDSIMRHLEDEDVECDARLPLAKNIGKHLPHFLSKVDEVLGFILDEGVDYDVRSLLARNSIKHLSLYVDKIDTLLKLVLDYEVNDSVRCCLAYGIGKHLMLYQDKMDAIWRFLAQKQASWIVRANLAIGLSRYLPQHKDKVDIVFALLAEEEVVNHYAIQLATCLKKYLPQQCRNKMEEKLSLLQGGAAKKSEASSFSIEYLPQHQGKADEVWALLTDGEMDEKARSELNTILGGDFLEGYLNKGNRGEKVLELLKSEIPTPIKHDLASKLGQQLLQYRNTINMVLALLTDGCVDFYTRNTLAVSFISHLPFWPDQVKPLLNALCNNDSSGFNVSRVVDTIPAYLTLPFYNEVNDGMRHCIIEHIFNHSVLISVVEQGGQASSKMMIIEEGNIKSIPLTQDLRWWIINGICLRNKNVNIDWDSKIKEEEKAYLEYLKDKKSCEENKGENTDWINSEIRLVSLYSRKHSLNGNSKKMDLSAHARSKRQQRFIDYNKELSVTQSTSSKVSSSLLGP